MTPLQEFALYVVFAWVVGNVVYDVYLAMNGDEDE